MHRLASWLAPLAWTGMIAWFSTDFWSGERTADLLDLVLRWLPWVTPAAAATAHGALRKLGHFTVYAILAGLWYRALVRGQGLTPRWASWTALGLSLAWAVLDEGRQALSPRRTASAADVAIDAAGAVAALWVLRLGWRAAVDAATSALLWVATVGGAAALALNLSADVPSGWLWLTAPAAAATLLVRRRRRARLAATVADPVLPPPRRPRCEPTRARARVVCPTPPGSRGPPRVTAHPSGNPGRFTRRTGPGTGCGAVHPRSPISRRAPVSSPASPGCDIVPVPALTGRCPSATASPPGRIPRLSPIPQ